MTNDSAQAPKDGGEASTPLGAFSNIDRRTAQETPYITDPGEVAALDIPREYVRRMEDAQRIYGEHHLQYRAFSQAKSHGVMTMGFQGIWLGVGTWVMGRGYRYSDPMNSVISRLTDNVKVRRLTTPISCLGLLIFSVTCTQLPYDVKMVMEASRGLETEGKFMHAAMRVRDEAYREGKDANERINKAENDSLNLLLPRK